MGTDTYPRWSVEGSRSVISWALRVVPQLFMAACRPRAMLRGLRMEHRIRPWPVMAAFVGLLLLPVIASWAIVTAAMLAESMSPHRAVMVGMHFWSESSPQETRSVPSANSGRVAATWWGDVGLMDRSVLSSIEYWTLEPGMAADSAALTWPNEGRHAWSGLLVITDAGGAVLVGGSTVLIPLEGPPAGTEQMASPLAVREGALFDVPPGLMFNGPSWGGPFEMPAIDINTAGSFGAYAFAVEEFNRVAVADVVAARGMTTIIITGFSTPRDILGETFERAPGLFLVLVAPWLLTGGLATAAFAVLPIARRRACVRWAHLGRLTIYAVMSILGLVALLIVAVEVSARMDATSWVDFWAWELQAGRWSGDWSGNQIAVQLTLLTVLTAIWWSWAAGHYLRMARPWAVGVSVAVLGTLIGMLAVVIAAMGFLSLSAARLAG